MKGSFTSRGFALFSFEDAYGHECSLQESSLAEPACIWFGRDENAEPHHVTKQPGSPRMHLTQLQVQELLPLLQRFAETGLLVDRSESEESP